MIKHIFLNFSLVKINECTVVKVIQNDNDITAFGSDILPLINIRKNF